MGNQELMSQLQSKGLETWMHTNNFVCFKFIVPLGRFKGQEIEIALQGQQFPMLPPSGPHIKPHHPFGGIHDRKVPTQEYQYWSRPFKGWTSGMTVDDYLAFLRTLLDFE
jgi:hypothetical protein